MRTQRTSVQRDDKQGENRAVLSRHDKAGKKPVKQDFRMTRAPAAAFRPKPGNLSEDEALQG